MYNKYMVINKLILLVDNFFSILLYNEKNHTSLHNIGS